jgi:hypothetical protein
MQPLGGVILPRRFKANGMPRARQKTLHFNTFFGEDPAVLQVVE